MLFSMQHRRGHIPYFRRNYIYEVSINTLEFETGKNLTLIFTISLRMCHRIAQPISQDLNTYQRRNHCGIQVYFAYVALMGAAVNDQVSNDLTLQSCPLFCRRCAKGGGLMQNMGIITPRQLLTHKKGGLIYMTLCRVDLKKNELAQQLHATLNSLRLIKLGRCTANTLR